jgi:hypothetical protein
MRVPVFNHTRFLSGLGVLLTTACGAFAAAAALDIASPFLPPSAASTGNGVTAGGPIELHGYMVTPEGQKFSIYDTAKKSATWVKINETGYPFVVRTYKVVSSVDQVTVDYQGNTLTLALKQPKIASAAQAGVLGQGLGGNFAGRGGLGGRGGGGGPGGAAAPAVPTAEEMARLQAAALDFQQRQAQRQQAQALGPQVLQQGGQGGYGNGNGGGGGGRRGRGQGQGQGQ